MIHEVGALGLSPDRGRFSPVLVVRDGEGEGRGVMAALPPSSPSAKKKGCEVTPLRSRAECGVLGCPGGVGREGPSRSSAPSMYPGASSFHLLWTVGSESEDAGQGSGVD